MLLTLLQLVTRTEGELTVSKTGPQKAVSGSATVGTSDPSGKECSFLLRASLPRRPQTTPASRERVLRILQSAT